MEKTYNQLVDERLATESPEIFGNFSRENAKYIVPAFIKSAKQSVTILGGSMPDEFYADPNSDSSNQGMAGGESTVSDKMFVALEAAAKTLAATMKKDGEIPIRIITLDSDNNEAIDAFVKRVNQVLGKQVIKIIHARYTGRHKINHYLIVDHKRYRLEEPHRPFGGRPPEILKAEVCCNGPLKAQMMEESFNRIWNWLLEKGRVYA